MVRLTSRDSVASIEEIIAKLPEITKSSPQQTTYRSTQQAVIRPTSAIGSKPAPTAHTKIEKKENIVSTASPHDTKASVDMTRVKDAWPILVKAMAVKKMSVSSYLAEGEPDYVKGNAIYVAFPKELNFHREVLEDKPNKDSIEAALSQILDVPIRLQFIASDKKINPQPETKEEVPALTKEELKRREPLIDSALDIFGGKILKARST